MSSILDAAFLGVLEALTEFLPVSSTGHLILATDLIGFRGPPGRVFEVVIQFGAILAVCVAYRTTLTDVARGLPHDPGARRFVLVISLAFLPALVLGALLHEYIKTVLFSPYVVSVALVVGGVAILVIERLRPLPRVHAVEDLSPRRALAIGLAQCLAMVPGVSRSGATIMGALLLGVERRTAAEFSFFLAIPTMLGAATYDLWQNRAVLTTEGGLVIAVGFVAAFLVALFVVRWFVAFVGRHGFAPFAWYRIGFGGILLIALNLE